ncbi:nucleotidyltransferase substrate binding protein [Pseudoduganella sp. LjRoot289]|uniref:nucleotidyltransferase substrate binding protein n=1 Tax=Pseudoduganella sp. LjRoot289 TaxID=3342314 RepID=UPI003ED0F80D
MDTQEIRWKQKLEQYQMALAQLTRFVDKGELNELEQQGLIKAFECTHELAWKVMKEYFEFHGNRTIIGSRDATRSAYQAQLIEQADTWLDMIAKRNRSTHTYNRQTANEIADAVLDRYYRPFLAFQQTMTECINGRASPGGHAAMRERGSLAGRQTAGQAAA